MEVPGIRRVRSRSIRGAAEISAQFDPVDRHGRGAAAGAEPRVGDPRRAAGRTRTLIVERLTPAVFPVFILSMTGTLPTADLNDYATYVVQAGARARARRRPDRGARQRHARDRGRPRSAEADGRGPDRQRRVGRAPGAEHSCSRSAASRSRASSTWRWRPACGRAPTQIAAAPVLVKNGATIRVADLGTVIPGSPDRTLLVTGNGRDAVSISISQQIGANILTLKQGVDAALERPHAHAAVGHPHHEGLRPGGVRRARRSPTCATRFSSAASSPSSC